MPLLSYQGVNLSQDGFLVFQDSATLVSVYDNIANQLKNMDNDSLVNDSVINEYITPYESFENQYPGYISLRMIIEDTIEYLSDSGTWSEILFFENHIISDDILRTFVSNLEEIQVGSKIYKFLCDKTIAEIPGNQINSLYQLRNDCQYRDENIKIHKLSVEEPICGTYDVELKEGNEVCFYPKPTQTNFCTEWEWDFGDGNTSNDFSPCHTYSQAGYYLTKFTLNCPVCNGTYYLIIKVGDPTCSNSIQAEFTWDQVGENITATNTSSGSYNKVLWTLKDKNGNPIQQTTDDPDVDFFVNTNGKYELCLQIINSDCISEKCYSINVDDICCDDYEKKDNEKIYVSGRKVYYKIWLNNFVFYHGCGAKTIHFIEKKPGKWKKKQANIYASIEGEVYKQLKNKLIQINCFEAESVYEADGKTKKSVQAQKSHMFTNRFVEKNALESTHKVEYNNTWYEYSLKITSCK